ncbi:uncharacterized protein PV07_05972 [Cladophialophora immunda]|uniref:Uncharacterized protein n=1 Tax=Cladophialophora immunda TaxID=569365 RepID=A0A0D2CGF4_9EURO|nr:uncharacterized protein PV07_05972 [Cladophialophora immunda]KIW30213.1 hypothetical protein PV07_05972 [Cladophialophora immunda]
MAPIEAPKLTHVFDLTVIGPPGFASEGTQHSATSVAHVYRGSLVSADGSINLELKAGSDWMTLHEGYAHMDARVSCASPAESQPQLQCDIRYLGVCAFDGPMLDLWKGKQESIDFGEAYYYTQPMLSSRSEALAWVNRTVFIAMGKLFVRSDGDVEAVYRMFKVG